MTVEGKKYVAASYECTYYDSTNNEYLYSSVGIAADYSNDIQKQVIPQGCPVIKYSPDLKIINNSSYTQSDILFKSFDLLADGSNYSSSESPTEPGMYWLYITCATGNDPMNNSSITPVVGKNYITHYRFLFVVVVE